ncbi:MAG TPA: GspE/PulE family protein [Candidatus Paceibacterota bacterium]|nr:GspE/PulE family protein [Candidatus Paceibacterota bacterium]
MTNDQLIKELETRRLLSDDDVIKLKRDVLVANRSAEEIIHERHLVDDDKVAELKSQILKVPYQKIDFKSYDPANLQIIPEETARTYGVVPLGRREGVLIAGMMQPDDLRSQEALKFIAHRDHVSLGVYVISYNDWQGVLRLYSPFKSSLQAVVGSLNLKAGETGGQRVISLEESNAKTGEEAPIIKIVSDTFKEAVQARASDVHVEPQQDYLRIRFRLDGDLKEVAALPVELTQPVTSRIKVISNLKIDETRIPQDGRFRAHILDKDIDFRVATFPTPLGEKIVIRILDSTTGLKNFDQLGLVGHNLEVVKKGLEKPYGMILITGPTGSGKTTTLYALLQYLNNETINIVSLEDPVEYFVSGINQSQVRPEIGYTFASGLRQILRQDPDVIMVGEIRDSETASLAVQAALTGHVVLATLHTNNSAGVIPRLMDMKVDSYLLPVSLNLMMAQRLVGILCKDCRTSVEAPPEMQEVIKNTLVNLPADAPVNYSEPYKIYHAPGCNQCKGKGITGRMSIMEVLKMTPGLEEVINEGPTIQKIGKESKAQGMLTMRQDGILKALEGRVSMEEVLRTTADE